MNVLGLLRMAFSGLTSPADGRPVRFEQEYPAELPDRLEFLEKRLGLTRERMLRLAGAPPAFAADPAAAEQSWDAIVAQQSEGHRQQLADVERILADFVSHFGYDCDAAAEHVRGHTADRASDPAPSDDAILVLLADAPDADAVELMTEFLSRRAA